MIACMANLRENNKDVTGNGYTERPDLMIGITFGYLGEFGLKCGFVLCFGSIKRFLKVWD
jgi:hypothetical protein